VSRRLGLLAPGALLAAGCAFLIAGAWIPVKADLAQQLLDRAWTATVEGSAGQRAPQRPWPWADTWPVARLTLPTSGRALTVLAGASGRNLAFGPALMDGSAPLGAPGVSVIAGHRDTHFSALGKLSIGDRFTLADVFWAASLFRIRWLGLGQDFAPTRRDPELPRVAAYCERLLHRPSVQRAIVHWPLHPPSEHVSDLYASERDETRTHL